VGPHGVVVAARRFDDDASFRPSTKPLEAEAFIPELPVEALVRPILPGLPWCDVRGVDVGRSQPAMDSGREEFGPVVRTKVLRSSMMADETRQHIDDATRADAAGDVDGEAFPRPLVHDGEALQLLAIGACIEDEVVGPNMVSTTRRKRPRPTHRHSSPTSPSRDLKPGRAPQPVGAPGAHPVAPNK
jgi:hypothetical protein